MSYASGKFAKFVCDTCGFAYPYKTVKTTWDGNRVCGECYEPKHPQSDPPNLGADAEDLWKPRPEVKLPKAQLGVVITNNASAAGMTFKSDPIGSTLEGQEITGTLGDVTVSIT